MARDAATASSPALCRGSTTAHFRGDVLELVPGTSPGMTVFYEPLPLYFNAYGVNEASPQPAVGTSSTQGLNTGARVRAKSAWLRVTTVKPNTIAVAAMIRSGCGKV